MKTRPEVELDPGGYGRQKFLGVAGQLHPRVSGINRMASVNIEPRDRRQEDINPPERPNR